MILPSCFCLKQIRVNLRNPWSGKESFKCFAGFGYKHKFTINFR